MNRQHRNKRQKRSNNISGDSHSDAKKPSKEEIQVAKWMCKNVKIKRTKLLNQKVEYFMAHKAIDALLNSKFAKGYKALFQNRKQVVGYLNGMLKSNLFHRANKIPFIVEGVEGHNKPTIKAKNPNDCKDKKEQVSSDDSSSRNMKDSARKMKKKIRLEMHPVQEFVDGPEAYVWIYQPFRISEWLYGFLVLLAVILISIFPLWPVHARYFILYSTIAIVVFVSLFISILVLRILLFCSLWSFSKGRVKLWVFPNFIHKLDLIDSFYPLYKIEYEKEDTNNKDGEDWDGVGLISLSSETVAKIEDVKEHDLCHPFNCRDVFLGNRESKIDFTENGKYLTDIANMKTKDLEAIASEYLLNGSFLQPTQANEEKVEGKCFVEVDSEESEAPEDDMQSANSSETIFSKPSSDPELDDLELSELLEEDIIGMNKTLCSSVIKVSDTTNEPESFVKVSSIDAFEANISNVGAMYYKTRSEEKEIGSLLDFFYINEINSEEVAGKVAMKEGNIDGALFSMTDENQNLNQCLSMKEFIPDTSFKAAKDCQKDNLRSESYSLALKTYNNAADTRANPLGNSCFQSEAGVQKYVSNVTLDGNTVFKFSATPHPEGLNPMTSYFPIPEKNCLNKASASKPHSRLQLRGKSKNRRSHQHSANYWQNKIHDNAANLKKLNRNALGDEEAPVNVSPFCWNQLNNKD